MSDAIDVEIEYLDESGDGIARIGRRHVAVPFTIPGEHVRIALDARRPNPRAPRPAVLLDVLRASPHRVTPGCRHFGPTRDNTQWEARRSPEGARTKSRRSGEAAGNRGPTGEGGCGGCSWQHIAYPEQLRLKSALVARLLEDLLQRPPAVKPTLPGVPENPWGYRHKVHFVFGNGAGAERRPGPLVIGHYERGSRRIVPIEECPVHDEHGNRVAFGFFESFRRGGITAAEMTAGSSSLHRPTGVLRSIAVRVAQGTPEAMATLVVSDDRDSKLRTATRRAMNGTDAPTALHLNIHPRRDGYIFGHETRTLAGPARLREQVAGTSFLISPTAFFQTNVYAAELLVRLVLETVPAGARVLDLYAGAGLFALPLARRGHQVVAVEENRAAVADGEASARLTGLHPHQCRFVARPVESVLDSLPGEDVVVLDPPRDGCAPGVFDTIVRRLRPRRVVYVSCNPRTLARDLQLAESSPYAIDTVQPLDMFPHTAHVETVVTLINRES